MNLIDSFGLEADVPTQGYGIFTNVLSDSGLIVFAVPDHGWSELEKSEEWKSFQTLLERYQEEHIQTGHKVVGCPTESPSYIGISDQQHPVRVCGYIQKHIGDILQSLNVHCRK